MEPKGIFLEQRRSPSCSSGVETFEDFVTSYSNVMGMASSGISWLIDSLIS